MTKTRPRLCAGSAFVAAVLIACGQTDDDGGGANGGSNGTLGGGSGGASAGQSQTSGGRSPTGGQGGTAAGAMASGGVSVGGDSGGEDTAGGAGLAGAGGAAECPAIKCAAVCAENWLGLDGCPTCACAPPAAKLSAGSGSCASASLTLAAASSYFIGGIDRWLLDLDWTCSHSGLLGEPARARLQVAIVQPLSPPIDSENRTFFHPRDALEYEVRTATVWLRGSGVPEIELSLIPSSSFLSVRIEKGLLVGGVEYVGSDSTNSSTATLAGPFIVAIPALN